MSIIKNTMTLLNGSLYDRRKKSNGNDMALEECSSYVRDKNGSP